MNKVWILMDGDYDSDWIVAVYADEKIAQHHADLAGLRIESANVLTTLPHDVEDTRAERATAAVVYRQQEAERAERDRRNHELAMALTLSGIVERGGKPSLCSCATFSQDTYFITPNGYCRYCGGWIPSVFRQHLGDAALSDAIDLLEHHKRVRMREITGLVSA